MRILLAEDNPINQKVAVGLLEKRGHEASAVGNGQQAASANAPKPDRPDKQEHPVNS